MKKFLTAGAAIAALVAVPVAQGNPGHNGSNPGSSHSQGKSKRCKKPTVNRAYNIGGTLVSYSLNRTQGGTTPQTGDDRYSGTVELTVTSTNKAARSEKDATQPNSYTVTDVRVSGAETDAVTGVVSGPVAGDNVRLHGKRTFKQKRNCTTGPAVGTVKWTKVGFSSPAPAPTA